MKAFGIIRMEGGAPALGDLPHNGYVLAAEIGHNWGAYIISGTTEQLQAINALPDTYPITVVSEGGATRWPELDDVIVEARRTRLNTWLTARGYPNIPAGWTYRQVVLAIYQRMNDHYTLEGTDISEG